MNANGEHEALLSNHKKRHVYFRVSVASLNEQKQVYTYNDKLYELIRNNSVIRPHVKYNNYILKI